LPLSVGFSRGSRGVPQEKSEMLNAESDLGGVWGGVKGGVVSEKNSF